MRTFSRERINGLLITMCCCGKPNINGEDGYSWNGKTFGIRKPYLPDLEEGDELIKDLPGRCGNIDSHSHDMRLVRRKITGLRLLVRHGGGEERIDLHAYGAESFIETMSNDDCYWMMRTLHSIQFKSRLDGRDSEAAKWRKAAAEKRIKTRKHRDFVKVWIESPIVKQLTNCTT